MLYIINKLKEMNRLNPNYNENNHFHGEIGELEGTRYG